MGSKGEITTDVLAAANKTIEANETATPHWSVDLKAKKQELEKYLEKSAEDKLNASITEDALYKKKYDDMMAKFKEEHAKDNSTLDIPEISTGGGGSGGGGTPENYFRTNKTYYEWNMTKGAEVALWKK